MDERRYTPDNLGRRNISIGKEGTSGAVRIVFDCAAWLAEYSGGVVTLHMQMSGGEKRKPVLGTEGTDRIWAVGYDDTKIAGSGVIELILTDGETGARLKSATGYIVVLQSPSAGTEDEPSEAGYVRYDMEQNLTEEDKARARRNIGAGTGEGSGSTEPGAPGQDGEDGEDGEDGGYYTPSVDSAGNLTWTASKADMPAVASSNIKGPKGDTGETGPAGADGAKGDKGDKGDTGEQGPAGADGKTPEKGTDYWTEADKAAIVNDVLAAPPNASGVNF